MMSEAVSVGIDIQGTALRFAEVQRTEDRHRLRRLGSVDFDFNVAHEVLRADEPTHLGQMTTRLQEALGETEAQEVVWSVHPPDAFSFLTPIEADLPVKKRKLHLLQHAALVTGARSPGDYHLSTQTVRTAQDSEGDSIMWVHVLAVSDATHARVHEIMDRLPVDRFSWILSTEAASRVTARTELTGITQEQALRPFTLAVGQYGDSTEYTLSRDRQWFHSHYAERAYTPTDRAYYAVGLLNRLDVALDAVGRIFVYGPGVEPEAYEPFDSVFGVHPEPLDPLRAVKRAGADVRDLEPTSLVPCIGSCMGAGM